MSKAVFAHAQVSDTAGVFVAADTASTRAIDAATVTNATGSGAVLSLWLVPNAGSRSDGNLLLKELSVTANSTVTLAPLINHAIPRGATIHAQAGTASALTLIISGRVA